MKTASGGDTGRLSSVVIPTAVEPAAHRLSAFATQPSSQPSLEEPSVAAAEASGKRSPSLDKPPTSASPADFQVLMMLLGAQLMKHQVVSARHDVEAIQGLTASERHLLEQAGDQLEETTDVHQKALSTLSRSMKRIEGVEAEIEVAGQVQSIADKEVQARYNVAVQAGAAVDEAVNGLELAREQAEESARLAVAAEQTARDNPTEQNLAEAREAVVVAERARESVGEAEQAVKGARAALDSADESLDQARKQASLAAERVVTLQGELSAARDEHSLARAEVEKTGKALEARQQSFDQVQLSLQQMEKWTDRQLTAVLDHMLTMDSRGASASLKAMLASGSAVAASLAAMVLQNNVSLDVQVGQPSSIRIQLMNRVAEREEINRVATRENGPEAPPALSHDLTNLYIGVLAGFQVLSRQSLTEVAEPEHTSAFTHQPLIHQKTRDLLRAEMMNVSSDIHRQVRDAVSLMAEAGSSSPDEIGEVGNAPPYQGLANKV